MPITKVNGYSIQKLPDGRVKIGPYTFSHGGKSISVDSSQFIQGGDYEWSSSRMDVEVSIAQALYQKYLRLKIKEKMRTQKSSRSRSYLNTLKSHRRLQARKLGIIIE